MTARLTLIQGGLRENETLLSKLMTRPEDFPEAIFQRVLKFHENHLDFMQMVSVLKLRANAARALQMKAQAEAEGLGPAA